MERSMFVSRAALLTLPPTTMLYEVLRVNAERNPMGEPWTREDPEQCASKWDATLREAFPVVEAAIAAWCGHKVAIEKAFELVLQQGKFVPPHTEQCALSAHLILQNRNPNRTAQRNYAGCIGVCNPAGAHGASRLPWEGARNECFYAPENTLLVFPAHLTHFFFPNENKDPLVTLGFEINLKDKK